MTSTFTTNKHIEKPGNGDYPNDWNVPVNADWDVIDQAFGGTTSLSVTGQSSTPVTLTYSQYQSLILSISGVLTANVTYVIPSGVGGQWMVANATTGSYTLTIASGGGGTTLTVPRNTIVNAISDGTNINQPFSNYLPLSGGTLTGTLNAPTLNATTLLEVTNTNPTITLSATGGLNKNIYNDGTNIGFTISAGGYGIYMDDSSNLYSNNNITAVGNVTAYSDANLKTEVTTIQNALSLVEKMRGVKYTRIDSGKRGIGVIAQEMQEVVPEAVHDTHGTLSVAYGNLVGVLIEAIKELSDKVSALEQK